MEDRIFAGLWAIGGLVVLFVFAALGSVLAMHIGGLSKAEVEPSNIPPSCSPDLNVPPSYSPE
jgi:hypothetical protein